jgi:hypothetical protein
LRPLLLVEGAQQLARDVVFRAERTHHVLAVPFEQRRLRSGVRRREHKMLANYSDIKPKVVAAELHPSRLRLGRLAEDRQEILIGTEECPWPAASAASAIPALGLGQAVDRRP